ESKKDKSSEEHICLQTLDELECVGERKEKITAEHDWLHSKRARVRKHQEREEQRTAPGWKQLLKWQFCKESKKDKSSEEHTCLQTLEELECEGDGKEKTTKSVDVCRLSES
ncbi:hypothetical protein V3C99_018319, partial [Haemonchus contortus]